MNFGPTNHVFVTGGAGFIGSNIVDRLLEVGCHVTACDNFSTGFRQFLQGALKSSRFRLVEGDVLDFDDLVTALSGHDFVFHMAANADVRFGTEHPRKDLDQNIIATFNVLEAMRATNCKKIAFASTGSIYGEASIFPTPEDAPFPIQTSLYGASKLASEGLIAAYCEGFSLQAWIFRFVSLLGERYTHGHIFDFYRKLLDNPEKLHVLGDGHQKKSYIYVQDCIDAILLAIRETRKPVNILNLGYPGYIKVLDSIRYITQHLALHPQLSFSGGDRGWIGDNPFIFLDVSKISSIGWAPKVSIQEAVIRTLDWLSANRWVFQARS